MFSNIGTTEILIVILLLLVIFGGNKVNGIARGLGEATKEFKKATKEVEDTKDEITEKTAVSTTKKKKLLKKVKK